MNAPLRLIAVIALMLSLLGCVTGEKMSQVHPGMTKAEVVSVLGRPDGYKQFAGYEVYRYSNRLRMTKVNSPLFEVARVLVSLIRASQSTRACVGGNGNNAREALGLYWKARKPSQEFLRVHCGIPMRRRRSVNRGSLRIGSHTGSSLQKGPIAPIAKPRSNHESAISLSFKVA